ncbi:hypothetical protein [Maribacter aurantiacus]|uniref:Periplasmic heavy metal sensor n=1 Tax=Maribacter aurantiacus TaxID=1882343 RepID=A0A5R8M811_9FLAO|nr:hypothetical protein [Maribacter aurantiacus]TLF45701.1 hypothetical protein FEK29_06155 [Maribacter aurantiacus]
MRFLAFKTFLLVLISFSVRSQADCLLGVGITENDSLADIFQMNDVQKQELLNLSAELKYRNEILNVQLENVYNRHPQNTVEELNQLALKYRNVMDSMQSVQSMIDKKLLALLNPKQYQLYLDLCHEASRSPFVITPKVYSDSIPPKHK